MNSTQLIDELHGNLGLPVGLNSTDGIHRYISFLEAAVRILSTYVDTHTKVLIPPAEVKKVLWDYNSLFWPRI